MGSGGGLFGGSTRSGSMYSGCCGGCCLVSLLQGIIALAAVAAIVVGIISILA